MELKRKQTLRRLAGIGVACSPVIGGIILTVVLVKRRNARRRRSDAAQGLGADTGNEVGEEAQLGKVDDPWASSGHSGKASKHADGDTDAAELPEPLPTTLLDETLPITPRDLWRLVMGDPDFFRSVADMKKNRDLKIGRWRLSKGDTAVRKVSYVTTFKKQVIGPKEAKATEVYESKLAADQGFTVDVKVHTPEVPYGSSFHSHLQWDALSVGQKQTRLRVSCEVAFTKPCLVKGIVKKASMEGMRESYSRFRTLLLELLSVAPGAQSGGASGNGGRPAVQQLLLLLLLGAAIILAIMASTRRLHGEPNWADHTASHVRSLLAGAAAALRTRAAPVQARLQGMAHTASHAVGDML